MTAQLLAINEALHLVLLAIVVSAPLDRQQQPAVDHCAIIRTMARMGASGVFVIIPQIRSLVRWLRISYLLTVSLCFLLLASCVLLPAGFQPAGHQLVRHQLSGTTQLRDWVPARAACLIIEAELRIANPLMTCTKLHDLYSSH
jgi:hypothetical protein